MLQLFGPPLQALLYLSEYAYAYALCSKRVTAARLGILTYAGPCLSAQKALVQRPISSSEIIFKLRTNLSLLLHIVKRNCDSTFCEKYLGKTSLIFPQSSQVKGDRTLGVKQTSESWRVVVVVVVAKLIVVFVVYSATSGRTTWVRKSNTRQLRLLRSGSESTRMCLMLLSAPQNVMSEGNLCAQSNRNFRREGRAVRFYACISCASFECRS